MRPIVKGRAPSSFLDWLALASGDWMPSYGNLRAPEKAAVLGALLEEQGGVCCYCEQRITGAGDCHIEHSEPQSVAPERQLDFANLRASCQGEQPTAPGHCGHHRGLRPLPVHPGLADCTDWFVFEADGSVAPGRDSQRGPAAAATIAAVNLNARKLVRAREAALSGVFEALSVAPVVPPSLIDGIEARQSDRRFLPHGSAIGQLLRRLAGSPPVGIRSDPSR
jgi:uncharacterized protein (TIGR02646 family)